MKVVVEEVVEVVMKWVVLPTSTACGHQGSHVLWDVQQML